MKDTFSTQRRTIDAYLDQHLPPAAAPPARLHEAMRYSVMAGGKRLRPLLALAACEAVGGAAAVALPAACAIELIHTYSLIHDDLPCMDDDDLRRGRPTCHKVYGEALALLAGDALLTLAFSWLASAHDCTAAQRARLVCVAARAAGSQGMVGGQVADLEATGQAPDEQRLAFVHTHKTGDLITASLQAGGIAGNGTDGQIAALAALGEQLGLAFQYVDDILDCTADAETLGKTPGKDTAAGKLTAVAVYGLEGARERATAHTAAAHAVLKARNWQNTLLGALAEYVTARTS
ncbi:polyprenyl synthetase family protein [bacterium]|nr:polyprenyl synthetase family protein [bacterium]